MHAFEGELEPTAIVQRIETLLRTKIVPGRTLLFLDEIQNAPNAIAALRYFSEEMPELHLIAAGSILEFALEKIGVPVGRVSFRFLGPLSFEEYLVNSNNDQFLETLNNHDLSSPMSEAVHRRGLDLLAEYTESSINFGLIRDHSSRSISVSP